MNELKLIIDKGPRAGETLPFTSRSVIRIGRVVRGNTIAIKDGGISSKHLSIQFEIGSGNWTILDLDSSNATILNGAQLVPNQPTAIKDGDNIKIGEFTSIVVKIEICEMSQLRRNPRRRGNGGEPENVAAFGSGLSQCGGGNELGLGDDNVVEVAPVKRNLRPRRGVACSKNDGEEVDSKCVVENVRRTRSSKKKDQCNEFNPTLRAVPESLGDGTDHRKLESFVEGEGKKVRGRKNLPDVSFENVRSGGLDEVSGQEGCSKSKKMAAIDGSLPSGSNKEVGGADVREELRVPNEVNSGEEDRDGLKKDDGVHKGVDLEKMTLGDWFDYLEECLPKQIYAETEAMILKMEQDAAKFQEFRLQQENASDKGKKPMEIQFSY